MLALTPVRVFGAAAPGLEAKFRTPPPAERPWVYYWWVKGNVTRQSIKRDLEEMKAKGIGGFLLFDARGYGEWITPPPPAATEFLSPQWRELVRFTMSEAHRLGLSMSMNLSTDGGALRAPWSTGANAPKKLIWTSTRVSGPRRFEIELAKPEQAHFWEVALLAVEGAAGPDGTGNLSERWAEIDFTRKKPAPVSGRVIDLAEKARGGRLVWDVPAGDWTILRFGGATMDQMYEREAAQGLKYDRDVDILNTAAVEDHFNKMAKLFLADAGPLAGKTLTYFYNVSWEGASPTWTPGFDRDFQKYRGYDWRPYLPVLAGLTVKDESTSRRFLEDYSRTIGDCFLNNCYRRLGELTHQAKMSWHSESGGPWEREKPLFRYSDQLAFWGANDMPQGEFWHQHTVKDIDGTRVMQSNMRSVAMSAHIYGRTLVAAESFTDMHPHWKEYPAVLKPDIDSAFIDGTNHVVWHTFDGSPAEFGKPGLAYFAGTHLNPNVTWWNDAGAFLSYLGRSQVMLRHGRFVADACVYASNNNYLHWGRGKVWHGKASLQLPAGYTYDLLNTEVLLSRLAVRNGALVLPDGIEYRMLVLDLEDDVVPVAVMKKIVELGKRRPERVPGLASADADSQLRSLAVELWGGNETPHIRRFGAGRIIRDVPLNEALKAQSIPPDFEGPFEYNHRRAADADIYFVTGSGRQECNFRVKGRQPEFWDAVSGSVRDAATWRATSDGRTAVQLDLPENGSVFVVFRRAASASSAKAQDVQWTKALPVEGPWQVTFAPPVGQGSSASFPRLTPWNENPRDDIRFFAGTATYRARFEVDAARTGLRARLQLGEVKNIARVRLNGKPLGVVWTAPWTVDLTGLLRAGGNEIEIDVTNTWANRLIGDASLTESQRVTRTMVRRSPDDNKKYANLRGYLATDPLLRSGLLGPVRVEFAQ
jgi:hypothetical protein